MSLSLVGSVRTCAKRVTAVVVMLGAALASQGATTDAYEQNGLIHHWDAYNNVGTGKYDSSAKTWVDLVRKDAMDLTIGGNAKFSTDADDYSLVRLSNAPTDSRMAYGSTSVTTAKTIEIVLKRKEKVTYAVCLSVKGDAAGFLTMKNDVIGSNHTGYFSAYDACNGAFSTVTLVETSDKTYSVYANGVLCSKTSDSEFWGSIPTSLAVGGRSSNANNCFFGRVYAVRLYSEALTADQIADNHVLDVKRFVEGCYSGDFMLVKGNPSAIGSPTPEYGVREGLAVGQNYTYTCPAAWTNAAETTGAVCTGWKLAQTNGTVTSGSELTKTVAYSDAFAGATLTWQWDVSHKVTAKTSGNGTVDKAEQWVKQGASASFTATAGDGAKFIAWTGGRSSFVSTATFADVQSPFSVRAEFGGADWPVRYVATAKDDGDGTATSPYTNVNVAVASVLDALGKSTGVVVIAEGTYNLTDTVTLTNAIRVIGMGMDKTTLSGTLIKGVKQNAAKRGKRGVFMKHSSAWMGGLSVTGCNEQGMAGAGIRLEEGTLDSVCSYGNITGLGEGYKLSSGEYCGAPSSGAGLSMSGGLATNCVIRSNNQNGSWGSRYGAGLHISGGTFTDGEITDNYCNRNQTSGAGVYVNGDSAIVRNTLIKGNNAGTYQVGDYTVGMGVYMDKNGTVENCRIIGNSVQGVYMTKGTLRNCLITGHTHTKTDWAAGVDMRGAGKVVNCTIWGNSAPNKFSGLYANNNSCEIVNNIVYGNGTDGDIKVTAGSCYTNVVSSTITITTAKACGNATSDPQFRDPSAGDFTFDNKSPACDKAAPRTDVTRDLVGTVRPQNAGPDIGCFECFYEIKGLEVSVSVGKTEFNVGEAVTAEATVFGATGEVTYEWSVDDVVYAGQEGATATFTGLSSGRHTISVKVSDGKREASGSVSDPISVKPTVVYVDDATGNDAENYPYDDATRPAKTVNAAFNALGRTGSNTTTVHIAAGTYTLTKELTLDTTVNILGAGRDVTVLSGASLPSTARCLSLTKAGSRVVGLTFRDCKTLMAGAGLYMTADGWVEEVALRNNEIGMGGGSTPESGAGLYQSAGVVTNCVISGNSQYSSYGTGSGVGVYIKGGTLVDSVVTNNWRNRNQLYGAGVYASGSAKVLRCKITGNSNKQGSWDDVTFGMGLYLTGGTVTDCEIVNNGRQGVYASGGTIKNCLIAGSKTAPGVINRVPTGFAGGLQLVGATVINCTIGGNKSEIAAQHDLLMTSGKFQNSIAEYAVVTGGTLTHSLTNASPHFRSIARGDYRLFGGSPAINAGDWTLFGKTKEEVGAATDLSGAPRLLGREIDMGCYENNASGLLLLVR